MLKSGWGKIGKEKYGSILLGELIAIKLAVKHIQSKQQKQNLEIQKSCTSSLIVNVQLVIGQRLEKAGCKWLSSKKKKEKKKKKKKKKLC